MSAARFAALQVTAARCGEKEFTMATENVAAANIQIAYCTS